MYMSRRVLVFTVYAERFLQHGGGQVGVGQTGAAAQAGAHGGGGGM